VSFKGAQALPASHIPESYTTTLETTRKGITTIGRKTDRVYGLLKSLEFSPTGYLPKLDTTSPGNCISRNPGECITTIGGKTNGIYLPIDSLKCAEKPGIP